MGVRKYQARGKTYWMIDETLVLPDGREVRLRKRTIPTREQAMALIAKARTEAFEGRYFERLQRPKLTVAEAWAAYEPINRRDNDAWQTEAGRARYLLRHLGTLRAVELTLSHVDHYRSLRFAQTTRTGRPPSPATLDREVELLKRVLNYAVDCGRLGQNPLSRARLLRRPNVRRTVVGEEQFAALLEAAEEPLRPILALAYETGMRRSEVLGLRWEQVDLKEGVIRLSPQDTKAEDARIVYLAPRALEALRRLPRRLGATDVFVNPATGKRWQDIRKAFSRACQQAGLGGVWLHDLRRSFVTNARRYGVPESVVMRMSGHRTRSVFDRYNIVCEEDLRRAVETIVDARLRQKIVKVSETGAANSKAPPASAERA
jgi:integrase